MSTACAVFCGQPGRSAARKSAAYSLAPVTLATPSMRPIPLAAGFHACRPGKVSRAAKLGSSAIARRDTLRAMPLAVTDVTNARREILIVLRLYRLPVRARRCVRALFGHFDLRGDPPAIWDPSPA